MNAVCGRFTSYVLDATNSSNLARFSHTQYSTGQTGNSPLAPGQWKGFLAVYAGFFVFNNIIRPVRLALAVGVTPYFNRFIDGLQNRFQVNRTVAIGLTVLIANVFGTLAFMSAGVLLAATLAGVPVYSKIVV
jgi:hypothetical protein